MNDNFYELLVELERSNADFLLVGAFAMAVHGVVRATGDLDIWVRPTANNLQKVEQALQTYGAVSFADFETSPKKILTQKQVLQFGRKPTRIDILVDIDGVEFSSAWQNRTSITLRDNLSISVIGRTQLLANKQATGRKKDSVDYKELEKAPPT